MLKKLKRRIAKLLIKLLGKDYSVVQSSHNIIQATGSSITGLNQDYLFDFKNWAGGFQQQNGFVVGGFGNADPEAPAPPQMDFNSIGPAVATKKIAVKPIDVLNELETVPTPFSLALLDEKIGILKDKEKHINQHYAKREVEALILRLQNRKQYQKHRELFERFQNTTEEKIDTLLKKYDLVMKPSDIFIPEFPDEAIKIMNDYSYAVNDICNKKPVYYVIATEDKFRKAYEKRDPILLVQSPFGFYYQILGAWDKEMILLSEL